MRLILKIWGNFLIHTQRPFIYTDKKLLKIKNVSMMFLYIFESLQEGAVKMTPYNADDECGT